MAKDAPIWAPTKRQIADSNLTRFGEFATAQTGEELGEYADLHAWSVNDPDGFWSLAWEFCGLVGDRGEAGVVAASDPFDWSFFADARLNIVDTFLKNADGRDAIIFTGEDGRRVVWSRAELKAEVLKIAAALRAEGITKGDRVAGYVPNMPQAVAAMLATASLGAVWSSCAPESGPDVVVDRFGQIDPKIMFAADGYFYNGKTFDTRPAIREVMERVTSIGKVVVWPYAGDATDLSDLPGAVIYDSFKQYQVDDVHTTATGFRDPLYVVYSSGTTGKPKCMEHCGPGSLLRLLVEHQIQCDVKPGDVVFYYATCNWVMWNWLVAALASEAAIVLFDGNPMYPSMSRLFDLAEAEKTTHFGISAKYIDASIKRRNCPIDTHDLSALRVVLSTGSPLSPDGFSHVYDAWKSDVHLASICGGTDILGAFIGGAPTLPVYRGEIQCAGLGMDMATLDDQGAPVIGVAGELVCLKPHPSTPTRFLNDPDNARYRASYYDTYPGIWRQGDYTIRTESGGFIVLGRSDATLNPGGVRIGTAEIYRQLDKIDAVNDSVVVGQTHDNDVRVVLFVTLAENTALDDALVTQIKREIRINASPRHVPAKIIAVADIPRTKSGKTAELAVRDVVNNQPVRNLSGIANPDALSLFSNLPDLNA